MQVQENATVGRAVAGAAVTVAADSQLQSRLAGNTDHLCNISCVRSPDDDCGSGIEIAEEHRTRCVVTIVVRRDDLSGDLIPDLADEGRGVALLCRHGVSPSNRIP
jgi:hypothetical protein